MSDILKEAQENYQKDKEYWSEIYRKAENDLHFVSDDENAQWTAEDRRLRENRPCLTVDQLGQFIHQVANNIRMNDPTINVIPEADADIETADILKGHIKHIEYKSNADEAYDTASLSAIRCSIGFIFVDHGYINDTSFEQEFIIRRCVNALQVWIDRDSIEADGSDAKRGIKIQSMSVATFKSRYPEAEVSSFGEEKQRSGYKDDDSVDVAEYYKLVEETKQIGLLPTGEIQEVVQDVEYSTMRTLKKVSVMRYILSGTEVLEEGRFPGRYIPIIPVYGEEAWIDGKRQLYSLIRKSKDAQRMYNYWKSLETELLMKQPVAPIMAGAGQVENYADDWKYPNKAMVLRYETHDADGNPLPAPQRLSPPPIPSGIVNAARATVDDIKATMGIYNASLGLQSNETSGIAISRRKEEGDVATYHFTDNLKRSMAQVGKLIVCGISELKDVPSIIPIRDPEGAPKVVGINGAVTPDQERTYDFSKGDYGVFVITGASSLTKRQEAADFFTEVVKTQPQLMQVMGDLLFKNMDMTGAQEMSERMRKVIDPKLLDDNQQADPIKEQMAQTIEQGKQLLAQQQAEIANLQQQLKSKDGETQVKALTEQNKNQSEHAKLEIEFMRLQQETEIARQENEIKVAELALRARELDIQEAQIAADTEKLVKQLQFKSNEQNESEVTDS